MLPQSHQTAQKWKMTNISTMMQQIAIMQGLIVLSTCTNSIPLQPMLNTKRFLRGYGRSIVSMHPVPKWIQCTYGSSAHLDPMHIWIQYTDVSNTQLDPMHRRIQCTYGSNAQFNYILITSIYWVNVMKYAYAYNTLSTIGLLIGH